MTKEIEHLDNSHKIIVRLLNGVLRGCEFTLSAKSTLFIVANENDIAQHHQGNVLPDNMIFIPSSTEQDNFEITLILTPEFSVHLRELNEKSVTTRKITTNEIITVGAIKLAIRHWNESFSDSVLSCQSIEKYTTAASFINKKSPIVLLMTMIVSGILGLILFFHTGSEQQKITQLSDLLNYELGHYTVIHGADNNIYLIAENYAAAEWALQSFVNNKHYSTVRVSTIAEERARIAQWLVAKYPTIKFHRIVMDSPQMPIIELSAERALLNEYDKKMLISEIKTITPYASDINFNTINDNIVSDLAEQGLAKNSLRYTRVNHKDSVTFIIQGALDDGELERMKAFINSYSTVWGEHYIRFAIDLKNDWIKGKSFKYGDRGYIKVSPEHWYFPPSQ